MLKENFQPQTKSSKIYLTGGSGQIGQAVRKQLKLRGLKPVILARKKSKIKLQTNESYLPFQLGECLKIDCQGEAIVLIHLAHDYFDKTRGEENINSVGLKRLFSSFKNYKTFRTIFLSTPMDINCIATTYQQQKFIAETICSSESTLVLKPSFVFSLNKGINKLLNPFSFMKIPLPLPNVAAQIAPVSDDSLANLIVNDILFKHKTGKFLVIGKEKMTFKDYLNRYHNIKSCTLHNSLLNLIVAILNKSHLSYSFYLSERIIGFQNLRDISDLQKIDPFILI